MFLWRFLNQIENVKCMYQATVCTEAQKATFLLTNLLNLQ